MRAAITGALVAVLAIAQQPDLEALYKAHRWAELHDALGHAKGNGFYRGAVATVFNEDPKRTEQLLLSAIKAAPKSEHAYEAYEWLSHLYLRYGQYRRLISIMDKRWAAFADKAERKEEQAALAAFRGLPDQVAVRTRESVVRHEADSIFIPLSINGSAATYFFDTGAWVSCMSESEAKRLSMQIQETSGSLATMTNSAPFRTAVARQVVIGEVRLKDVSFAVFPDDREPWSALAPGRRGLIGMPILVAFRTLRWTHDGAVEFGAKPGPLDVQQSNLIFDEDHLAVFAKIQGRKVLGTLDTGALTTDLYNAFADQFPSLVESATKESHEVRGVGGAEHYASATLPDLDIQIGGVPTVLRPAHVLRERKQGSYAGNFGLDLLKQGRAFKIDFGAMTLEIEKQP